ncbi:MAG: STAS domain-containing protein, partial [Desulfobacterales bacterium]|nr:STAS domain-containing protein [Desulfobacterales bacterium]
ISSAGLRVFISIQKHLKQISGKIVICSPSEHVTEVFKISAFDKLFDIVFDNETITPQIIQKQDIRKQKVLNGIPFEYLTNEPSIGNWSALVSKKNLITEFYDHSDAYTINAEQIRFGCGLSAPGNSFEDCKNFIGESLVVDGNYFYYPAIKNAAVDFILEKESGSHMTYQFLSGFMFNGEPSYKISFGMTESSRSLSDIIKGIGELVDRNLYGIIGVLESAGIWGMNFKKSPIVENFPKSGSMQDKDSFYEFMDFPIEAGSKDHIIVIVGLAYKEKNLLSEECKSLFPEESKCHIHGVIMEKGPVSRNIDDFQREIDRIFTELNPLKVQHLLQKSQFKGGLIGVILLD